VPGQGRRGREQDHQGQPAADREGQRLQSGDRGQSPLGTGLLLDGPGGQIGAVLLGAAGGDIASGGERCGRGRGDTLVGQDCGALLGGGQPEGRRERDEAEEEGRKQEQRDDRVESQHADGRADGSDGESAHCDDEPGEGVADGLDLPGEPGGRAVGAAFSGGAAQRTGHDSADQVIA
jgi:hypothetical protein